MLIVIFYSLGMVTRRQTVTKYFMISQMQYFWIRAGNIYYIVLTYPLDCNHGNLLRIYVITFDWLLTSCPIKCNYKSHKLHHVPNTFALFSSQYSRSTQWSGLTRKYSSLRLAQYLLHSKLIQSQFTHPDRTGFYGFQIG